MEHGTALVIGATGVVGEALLAHLLQVGGWNVITVSRRRPSLPGESSESANSGNAGRYRHVSIDLLDPADCVAKAVALKQATHVFHCAYVERADRAAWVADNTAMLVNLVEALEPVAPGLAHIHVTHGTKWYGSHLGPFRTPAKEDDPRHMPPNFYYDQWDWLAARQRGKAWTFSSARPHSICGTAVGNPMNLPMVIGVHAAISRELGLPLHHPGTERNFRALYQATDSELLARAMVWMATDERCANQAYNITNGDLIRWENVWPRIARYWGMEAGASRHLNLARTMADKGPVWQRIVERYGLVPRPYESLVGWPFGDAVFGTDYDVISDTGKCRRHGFHECVDTEEMFFRVWDRYRAAGVLPR
jgi:nucleoside-diphosphate-sugar epimerase